MNMNKLMTTSVGVKALKLASGLCLPEIQSQCD